MTNVEKLRAQVLAMKALTISMESLVGDLSELPEETVTTVRICKMYDDYVEGVRRQIVRLAGKEGEVKFKAIEGTLRNVTNALVQDLQIKH